MGIYKLGNMAPKLGKNNFVADTASVIGDVETEDNVGIWFSAVLRGDVNKIIIGENSNIQDNCTLHGSEINKTIIGKNVSVGHNCVIHGCIIGDNVLVGMGSVILNGSIIPENCIISAGSVISEKLIIPKGSLVAGSPAKVIKEISDKYQGYIDSTYRSYVENIKLYNKIEKI